MLKRSKLYSHLGRYFKIYVKRFEKKKSKTWSKLSEAN